MIFDAPASAYASEKRDVISASGPTRTSRGVRAYVACWVKADVPKVKSVKPPP
jgi:hypothetical protein